MKIAIIGGGIAGLSAAIALKELDADIEVFEAAPKLEAIGAGLMLAVNAVKALHVLGVAKPVLSKGNELEALTVLDQHGRPINHTDILQMASRFGTVANFSIHRADLQAALVDQLGEIPVRTNKRLQDAEINDDAVVVSFDDGTTAEVDVVIGADGIHSVLRQKWLPESRPRYAGYTCWRAVIERPEGIPPNRATETWGAGRRFGIVPMANEQLYWFATLNAPQPQNTTYRNYSVADLKKTFAGFHDPIPSVLEQTPEKVLLWNDILDIRPIARFAFGPVLLTGDAAHATTPNMGQGACQALEDSATLRKLTWEYSDLREIFQLFEQKRLARTTWVTTTSRRIGAMAQWENGWLRRLRDEALRLVPPSFNLKQLERLFEVEF
jgi:2-polyprenyl-6-methoxyphenol hydroxylase-like FAD-dependent oxidoreductase